MIIQAKFQVDYIWTIFRCFFDDRANKKIHSWIFLPFYIKKGIEMNRMYNVHLFLKNRFR